MLPFLRTRLSVLANILCLLSAVELIMGRTTRTYKDQLWDPDNWTVCSFQDNTGTFLTSAANAADITILRTAGSATTNTPVGDLRPANVILPASVSPSTSATLMDVRSVCYLTHSSSFLNILKLSSTVMGVTLS